MTPGARVAAAIDILERILEAEPAEKALTGWARRARYAGSKDRAAVRDHVYDVLRRRNSCAARGGAATGARGLMLGLMRQDGQAVETLFTGPPYSPEPLSDAEMADPGPDDVPDVPEWLLPVFEASLGDGFAETIEALRHRAPVMLRVNLRKASRQAAQRSLSDEGIETLPCEIADTALRVTQGARQVVRSAAFQSGLVELQDGSSQAAVARMDVPERGRVLDLCAGGGGKSLALAARSDVTCFAHDLEPRRMQDIAARAARSGVEVHQVSTCDLDKKAPFDMVLCDVPCSGSGTWRRTPDAKWRLTPERLLELQDMQDAILDRAVQLAGEQGRICYMTCSLLESENEVRIAQFKARHPGWRAAEMRRWPVSDQGDGFFAAHLMR